MDQMMNGYEGCQSSSQGCEYGYDVQQEHCVYNQEAYTYNQEAYPHQQWNNQGMCHQQQWNDDYQDSCSSSSQDQEPSSRIVKSLRLVNGRLVKIYEQEEEDERVLSVVDEMTESSEEDEIRPMVSPSSTSQATLSAHCNVTNQSHIDKMQLEENEKFLDDFAKRLASPIDEECARDDSNDLTPKALDLARAKESLQALLRSNDMGEFHSKVDHLRFILENKEGLGDLLQEVEEEQSSNLHMRTLFKEAPSMGKKEIDGSKEVSQVENMVEKPNMFIHFQPHEEQREILKPLKRARRRRKKKPKATKGRDVESKSPLLTFIPLKVVDGKLECKVRSSNGIKPFAKVKILLSPPSQDNKGGMISEKMARLFNMKLGDYGPKPPYDPPPLHH